MITRTLLFTLGVTLALAGLLVAAIVWATGVRFDPQEYRE